MLLQAVRLQKFFPTKSGGLAYRRRNLKAVDDVSFAVDEGQALGIVGESGCGKSTTAKMLLGILRPTHGQVLYRGADINNLSREDLRRYRSHVQAVLQDPWASLNPRMRVIDLVGEPLLVHHAMNRNARQDRVRTLLEKVGLDKNVLTQFPHEFSGGQRQRIAIARALASNPDLMILDEPVSSLDVSIRAQILNLLADVRRSESVAYIYISHDLSSLRYLCDELVVLYLGQVVECGPTDEVFDGARHPYTKALLAASQAQSPGGNQADVIIEGDVPSPICPPKGCRFHTRCPWASNECTQVAPAHRAISERHSVLYCCQACTPV